MTAQTTALTVKDIETGYLNDGWLGFGYLGGRRGAIEAIRSGEWTVDNVADADELALAIANEKGWTAERFFEWMNSKHGRWFADIMLGGEITVADVEMASKYVR